MGIEPVSCELFTAYLLGELTDEDMQSFNRHLQSCDDCRNEFRSLSMLNDTVLSSDSVRDMDSSLPPNLKRSTLKKAFSTREPRKIPWHYKVMSANKFNWLQMISAVVTVFIVGLFIGDRYVQHDTLLSNNDEMYMINEITLRASEPSSGANGVVMLYRTTSDCHMIVYVHNLEPLKDQRSCYTLWTSINHTWRNIGDFTVTDTGTAAIPINDISNIDSNSLRITLEPSWNDPQPKGSTVLASSASKL